MATAVSKDDVARGLQVQAGAPASTFVPDACGGAYYWARDLARNGHDVKLIAGQYLKPFVKRQKNDAAVAEADRGRGATPRDAVSHPEND